MPSPLLEIIIWVFSNPLGVRMVLWPEMHQIDLFVDMLFIDQPLPPLPVGRPCSLGYKHSHLLCWWPLSDLGVNDVLLSVYASLTRLPAIISIASFNRCRGTVLSARVFCCRMHDYFS